ncbi:uncharacterized protein LOC143074678 [Mytilus galloprovincialis]
MMYFKEYAENFGEQQPDCPEIHLPSCLTKIAVFKDYKLQCDVSQQPSISLSSFYEMWRKEFSHVKLRKHQKLSKCTECTLFKEALLTKLTKEQKEELLMKRKAHFALQLLARQKYYKHRAKARSSPQHYLSLIIDNMDQAKTTLPRFSLNSKTDSAYAGVHHHVTGALCHGFGLDFGFTWTDRFHPDSNVTLNCLLKVLHHVKEINDNALPPVLYLQADNCGKDNKNHFVLMFLAALVKAEVFKKIKLSFLMVGHTHEDVDQLFSRVSTKLCQENAPTLPELHARIREASTPSPIVSHLNSIFNFKEKLINLNRCDGIKAPHIFKFVKDGPIVKMSIKDWPLEYEQYRTVNLENIPTLQEICTSLNPVRKNPKIDSVTAAMVRDLPKWKQAGRLTRDQHTWWQEYLEVLNADDPALPSVPLPTSLPKFQIPAVERPSRALDPNILEAINRHIVQLQTSSEIQVVRPRRR